MGSGGGAVVSENGDSDLGRLKVMDFPVVV